MYSYCFYRHAFVCTLSHTAWTYSRSSPQGYKRQKKWVSTEATHAPPIEDFQKKTFLKDKINTRTLTTFQPSHTHLQIQKFSFMHIPFLHTPPFITAYFFKQGESVEMIVSRHLYTHSFLFPPPLPWSLSIPTWTLQESLRKSAKVDVERSQRCKSQQGCFSVVDDYTQALCALRIDSLMTNYPLSADSVVC